MNNVRSQMLTITPEMARKMLDKTPTFQRKLNKHRVDSIAEDIKKGLWEANGATIVMSKRGNLIDGQHRCAAIIEAGVPVESLVVMGVDDDAYATIDSGKARSARDALGERGCAADASIARHWIYMNRCTSIGETCKCAAYKKLSSKQISQYFFENTEEIKRCRTWYNKIRGTYGKTSLTGFAVAYKAIWNRYGARERNEFLEDLCAGIESQSSVIRAIVKAGARGALPASRDKNDWALLILYAHDKWRNGAPVSRLAYQLYKTDKYDPFVF